MDLFINSNEKYRVKKRTEQSFTVMINLNDSSSTNYFFDWNNLPDKPYKVYCSWICSNASMGIGHGSGQYLQSNIFDGVYSNNYQFLNSSIGGQPVPSALFGYGEWCGIPFAQRPDDNATGLYLSRRIRIDADNPITISSRPRVNNFQVYYMTCFNSQNPIDVYSIPNRWEDIYGVLQFKFIAIDDLEENS